MAELQEGYAGVNLGLSASEPGLLPSGLSVWTALLPLCFEWRRVGPACAPDAQTDPPRGAPSWCAYLVARASLGPRPLVLCAAEGGQRE